MILISYWKCAFSRSVHCYILLCFLKEYRWFTSSHLQSSGCHEVTFVRCEKSRQSGSAAAGGLHEPRPRDEVNGGVLMVFCYGMMEGLDMSEVGDEVTKYQICIDMYRYDHSSVWEEPFGPQSSAATQRQESRGTSHPRCVYGFEDEEPGEADCMVCYERFRSVFGQDWGDGRLNGKKGYVYNTSWLLLSKRWCSDDFPHLGIKVTNQFWQTEKSCGASTRGHHFAVPALLGVLHLLKIAEGRAVSHVRLDMA